MKNLKQLQKLKKGEIIQLYLKQGEELLSSRDDHIWDVEESCEHLEIIRNLRMEVEALETDVDEANEELDTVDDYAYRLDSENSSYKQHLIDLVFAYEHNDSDKFKKTEIKLIKTFAEFGEVTLSKYIENITGKEENK